MMSACSLPIETAGRPLVETPEEVVLDEDSICCGLVDVSDAGVKPVPSGQSEASDDDRDPLL